MASAALLACSLHHLVSHQPHHTALLMRMVPSHHAMSHHLTAVQGFEFGIRVSSRLERYSDTYILSLSSADKLQRG
jgi:hypothetical protein